MSLQNFLVYFCFKLLNVRILKKDTIKQDDLYPVVFQESIPSGKFEADT